MQTKKCVALCGALVILLCGCATSGGRINAITREDGSGTRDAFCTALGITRFARGQKQDTTDPNIEVSNSTGVVLLSVEGDRDAVGYISSGSVGNRVKMLKLDGILPTADTVKSGSYGLTRDFGVVTGKQMSPEAKDFVKFLCSDAAAKIIEKAGYIPVSFNGYKPQKSSGRITVSGSSSVSPVIVKLAAAYEKQNPDVKIEVQQNDSTTGISGTAEGISDIGMTSRELDGDEKKLGLNVTVFARDAIALIVNRDNPIDGITSHEAAEIYKGNIKKWSELDDG